MSLWKNIEQDLIQALKNKEQLKVSVLRMLKSAVQNQLIADKVKELSDQDIIVLIRKELKKRQDSITAFTQAGRDELAQNEQAEADILSVYMPAMLLEEELGQIVTKVIETGANNFGQVMKEVMAQTKGLADGQLVQKLVKEKLDK
ncbi:GatB/YqeY domain-containing protein [bacterium]|jgi:uncharacterized protein|nr:GatB/YqeY domain-containing protein [bacterium]MBT4648801.1 GatB/YqeY domain-containing protein [bacterium]